MDQPCLANDFSPLFTLDNHDRLLKQALEDIVTELPPREQWLDLQLSGFWSGPTGLAYLFLQASSRRPHLEIGGHDALTWAKRYMAGSRGDLPLDSQRCGTGCEKLVYDAVQACISKDLHLVKAFTSNVPEFVRGRDYPDELLHGRAGTLYLLRMIRHWVPDSAPLVEGSIRAVSEAVLADGPEWRFHDKHLLGAVHGDIGIVTQLVLTTPSISQLVEGKLVELLDAQLSDGNWPSSPGKQGYSRVQFCHGAPAFVHSLLALRPHFPGLQQRIDLAIERGQQCIWEQGLLVKEPSLCHGILGNAL